MNLREAVANLIKVKGRHNTEIAYQKLIEAFDADKPREWQGLTDEEVMIAAFQAGFDVHEDYDNEDDPSALHWWSQDGEVCDDSLLKLRDLIEAKLKEKNT